MVVAQGAQPDDVDAPLEGSGLLGDLPGEVVGVVGLILGEEDHRDGQAPRDRARLQPGHGGSANAIRLPATMLGGQAEGCGAGSRLLVASGIAVGRVIIRPQAVQGVEPDLPRRERAPSTLAR